MTANEADKAYGLRNGTAMELWRAGRVRGKQQPGRGRSGIVLRLFVPDLDREICGVEPAKAEGRGRMRT